MPRVVFDATLTKADLPLGVEGRAAARVGIKWTPLDAGHIVCYVRWTEHKDLVVSVPRQDIAIKADAQYLQRGETLWIVASVKTSDLKVELRPGPRDLILDSYNMQLSCPLINNPAVRSAALVLDAAGAVPELGGNFTFPEMSRNFEFKVEPMIIEIGEKKTKVRVSVRSTAGAILVQAAQVK